MLNYHTDLCINQMSKYENIQSLIKVIIDSLTDFNCMAKFYKKIDKGNNKC